MSCVKTGADVYLAQYGVMVHCDLHRVGDVWVVNHRGCEWQHGTSAEGADFVIYEIAENFKRQQLIMAKVDDCGWRE